MLEDYQFGDPKNNGKGHQLIKWKGKLAVKMPGPKVWKVKRRREKAATIKQILNDGTESFVANRIAIEHAELEAQLFGDAAEGEVSSRDQGRSFWHHFDAQFGAEDCVGLLLVLMAKVVDAMK